MNGRSLEGPNRIAGEWGHNPLPWMSASEYPGPPCYCGKRGCVETFVSGPGFEGHVPAPAVAEVDGTGSGDAFAAGLLFGTLAGWGLERSARFACAAGALATTALGAYHGVRGMTETLAVAGSIPAHAT